MKISIIAAMDKNRLIGNNNQLPWHLPADLKHFKQLTINKPVIMGRKTFDSIGKPLVDRLNIIITRDNKWSHDHCFMAHSLPHAIELAGEAPEIMIIGGKTIYEQALPIATHLYLTQINGCFEGNVYFPKWNNSEWTIIDQSTHLPDEKNTHEYLFVTYSRKAGKPTIETA